MPLTLRKRDRTPRIGSHAPGFELDRALAERLAKGDRQALSLFVERHSGSVYKYVMRYLGPGQDELAAQVLRATFADALKRMHAYASGRASVPMSLWLLRRANHHIARRRKAIQANTPEAASETQELVNLRRAMRTMPPRHASALSAALFEAVSPEDMGYVLGVSPPRAMRRLRAALRRVSKTEPVEEGL